MQQGRLPEFIASTLPPPQQWRGRSIWRSDLGYAQSSDGLQWLPVGALSAAQVAAVMKAYDANTGLIWPRPHSRYWFHGFAPGQGGLDGVFRDLVAGSNGAFGANLTRTQAWADRANGYVSTVDPVGGSTDSVIRIPGPNFDYSGGESLLIFWAGQATPEGSDTDIMGTSGSTAANGLRVRAISTGRLAFALHSTTPTSLFSTTSTDNAAGKPFVSGEQHSFALFINGQSRTQTFWVDGQINVNELALSSGNDCNTLSAGVWSIGTATPAGGTTGIATKTLAFAGLKFLSTDTLPATSDISTAVAALHRSPGSLILDGAL